MERITWRLMFLFILMGSIMGCKKEEPISYEDALKNCKPDSMSMINFNGDTTKIPFLKSDCVIGAQFPMFIDSTIDGRPVDAEYFMNKINVLNFWFIGCQPCQAEMPGFNALVEKYKGKPVNFMALSRNKPKDIEEFLQEHPFNVDHVGWGELITQDIYHMRWGYPTTMVTDANNKIIFTKSGGADDTTAVQKIQEELIPVIDGALEKM